MTYQNLKQIGFIICSLFLLAACEKDKNGEEELIETGFPLEISENIESPTIWKNRIGNQKLADYIITKSIEINADLIIEPGVRIEVVKSGQIDVNGQGSFNAVGTAAEPIVITGELETAGHWRGIRINSPNPDNQVIYTHLKYGGEEYYRWSGKSILWLDKDNNSTAKIQNSTFEGSLHYGLYADEGTELVDFKNNTFVRNGDQGLKIFASSIGQLDTGSDYNQNNNKSSVYVVGNEVNRKQTWRAINTSYFFDLEHTKINDEVTVMPGAKFKMGKEIQVEVNPSGTLNATGTAAQTITFTGNLETHGHWRGIRFNSPNDNRLEHVEIAHAANRYYKWGGESAVWVDDKDNGKLTMKNCEIHTNNDWGLTVAAGADIVPATETELLSDNNFHDNGKAASPKCTGDCNVNIK